MIANLCLSNKPVTFFHVLCGIPPVHGIILRVHDNSKYILSGIQKRCPALIMCSKKAKGLNRHKAYKIYKRSGI